MFGQQYDDVQTERLRSDHNPDNLSRRERRQARQKSKMQPRVKRLLFVICFLILLIIYQTYQNSVLSKKVDIRQSTAQIGRKIWYQAIKDEDFPTNLGTIPSSSEAVVDTEKISIFEELVGHLLMPYQSTSCNLRKYGGSKGAGFVLCQNFLPKTEVLLNFDIVNEDSFGCNLSEKYPIVNYQLSCKQKQQPQCQKSNPEKNIFEQVCLSPVPTFTRSPVSFSTLHAFMEKKKLLKKKKIIKIDLDGDEWEILSSMPFNALSNIDQMLLVLHFPSSERLSTTVSWNAIQTLRSLLLQFVPVNLHMNNNHCHIHPKTKHFFKSSVVEVTLVNRQLITINQNERSFETGRNNPSNPSLADCQL